MLIFSKKYKFKKLFFAVVSLLLITTATFAVIKNVQNQVDAATEPGAIITVNSNPQGEGWPSWPVVLKSGQPYTTFESPKFDINGATGFCIDPWMNIPTSSSPQKASFAGNTLNDKAMKLAVYIYTHSTTATNGVMSQWGISRNDLGFAKVHAIVSYISNPSVTTSGKPNGDYPGTIEGWSTMMSWLQSRAEDLKAYVNDNATVWQEAEMYQLYKLDASYDQSIGIDKQNVIWIEYNPSYYPITVKKIDHDTNSSTPQGNANLEGIHFQVKNNSGRRFYNPHYDKWYDPGQVVAEGNTDASGAVTFQYLLAGINYEVRETIAGSTNVSYNIVDSSVGTITLMSPGKTFEYSNEVKRGKIEVSKQDKETASCSNRTSGLTLKGTKIKLINKSDNPIIINGNTYGVNEQVGSVKTLQNDCEVIIFDNLPYGKYQIVEVAASEGYIINNLPKDINIPTDQSYEVTFTFPNQPIRGDVKFIKRNKANNQVMPNVVFEILALDVDENDQIVGIKESHYVVSDQNGVVDTSATVHSFHTNGYDALIDARLPVAYKGYGTWFGKDSRGNQLTVKDDSGALPYGHYIIQEIACDATTFCTGINEEKYPFEISENGEMVELFEENGNYWDNDCAEFSLGTTASDAEDGDKYVEAIEEAKIKDEVSYCAKPGMDFTIKGIIMDKETNNPLLVDGETIESSVVINPETECGTADMTFEFDATGLGGHELVVFETMYYENEEVASHEDIDDEGQTIEMVYVHTYATEHKTGEKVLPLNQDVEIKDTVKYCLIPGLEYTIKGILMDKETGNPLLINDKTVEDEITFTPEERCGELEMSYRINTAGLGGKKLVIFESLYRDEELLLEHKNINDVDESIEVELPAPDTGANTKNHDGGIAGGTPVFIGAAIVLCLGGYVTSRLSARKRFHK